MTIYDIDEKLRALEASLAAEIEEADGEITENAERIMEALDDLDIERDRKIEGACLLRREILSEVNALDAEIKHMLAKKKARERRAERLKEYISYSTDGKKFKTAKVSVFYRKNESVDVSNVDSLPAEYKRIKVEPDKTALKKALKAGKTIDGAELSIGQSIIIK